MSLFKRGNVWWAYVMMGRPTCEVDRTGNRKLAEQVSRQFHDELKLKRLGATSFCTGHEFRRVGCPLPG